MELSKRIKELRTEKGWSQETLAEKAYVSRQTVSNWETEKSYPDVHSLLILSDIFGVSLDNLIKGDIVTMKETIKNEDRETFRKDARTAVTGTLVVLALVIILPVVAAEFGVILAAFIYGVHFIFLLHSIFEMKWIMKSNDICTYREVVSFMNGETLDDIEKAKEKKERDYDFKIKVLSFCLFVLGTVPFLALNCIINNWTFVNNLLF